MKLKDLLKPVMSKVFTKPEELDLFLSASAFNEIDVPDETTNAFNSYYFTRERAMADPEIISKLTADARGHVYGSVDTKLEKIIPLLNEEDQNAIRGEKLTLPKIELLAKAVLNLNRNEDGKKISEAARKKEEELRKQIKDLEDNNKEKNANFAKQLKDVKLDYALMAKAKSIPLADEFNEDVKKNFLASSTIDGLKKSYLLELDENDESIIHLRKNIDGVISNVYEGNDVLTVEKVLAKAYDPFTKKSASTGESKIPEKKQVTVKNDQPVTLRDRMLAANP